MLDFSSVNGWRRKQYTPKKSDLKMILVFVLALATLAEAGYPPSPLAQDLYMPYPPGTIYRQNQNFSVVHRLMWHLFSRYHKSATLKRPVVINLDVLLIKVKGAVEKEGIFETVIAIFIRWNDERLSWDPQEYDNLTSVSLDPEVVGLPDIAMINSADHLYGITRNAKFQVHLNSNGFLKYVPTGTARTWCDLKLFTFPFDVQTCSLEFESWSLDHKSMTFDGLSDILLDKAFISQLWLICRLESTTYDQTYFTNETFTRVRFDITVKRRQTFYVVNLIFPCTTLSLIQLCVFWISSTDTTADRIGFSTTNLLTLVVFQTIVTEELPKTSDAVTALSKYIIALILTSAFGIFESVIIERFFRTFQKPPPYWLFRLLRPVPFLWRELPTTHPTLEEVASIYKSYEERLKKLKLEGKAEMVKRKSNGKVKRQPKFQLRRESCTSPVFSPRSSLIEEERLRLVVESKCQYCTMPSKNGRQTISKYGTVNGAYVCNDCDLTFVDESEETPLSNGMLTTADGKVTVPLMPLAESEMDAHDNLMLAPSFLNDRIDECCSRQEGKLPNYSGLSRRSAHVSPLPSPPMESDNHGFSARAKRRKSSHFTKFDTPWQRLVKMPAMSPRLVTGDRCSRDESSFTDQPSHFDSLTKAIEKPSADPTNKPADSARQQSGSRDPVAKKKQERNACLWMELAFKIDFITFFICALLSFFIPIGLFVPLLYLGSQCIPSHTLL